MLNRRSFLALSAAGFALSGTVATAHSKTIPDYNLPPSMQPRRVAFAQGFAPGEIHVFPDQFELYWTMPNAQAMRYKVGVGRPGLYESGEFYVGAKKEWPSWTPTQAMIEREPEKYQQFADGMAGGIENPLGARALYLFTSDRGDTFLRIHGTNEPSTIGVAVSNGCTRLVNNQIGDLYERVPVGTPVFLHPKLNPATGIAPS
ncbi:L,D-transpeptidase [Palleronia sp.]|uniref:L,D-transpeptidase n=1 Tax=Palleronia sp. TaxID=1940284 RepID=UPI0035C79589